MSDFHDEPPVPHYDGSVMSEVQRSLGRIEGMQKQILDEFTAHKVDDRTAFEIINKAFEVRDSNIAILAEKVAKLKEEQDTAKGAGKAILALLAAAATFVGGAVVAFLKGHIKFS